jgi:hypothetical protein
MDAKNYFIKRVDGKWAVGDADHGFILELCATWENAILLVKELESTLANDALYDGLPQSWELFPAAAK